MIKEIIFMLIVAAPAAMAAELNSTDYRVTSQIFDFGGQVVNGSSYTVAASIPDLAGTTNNTNAYACLGYLCISLEQAGAPTTVTFLLNFNISGPANDVGYVDTKSFGFYRPLELNKLFTCVEDTGIASTPVFGIVFSGEQLNYLELQNSSSSYILRASQFSEGNKFLLPVTTGGCSSIGAKLPLTFLTPFVSTGEISDAVQLVLSYPFTDIVGNFEKSGSVSLILEKNDTNQIVVDVI